MRFVRWTFILFLLCAAVMFGESGHRVLARSPERVTHQDFPPVPGGTPVVIGLPNLNPPTATAVTSNVRTQKPIKPHSPQDAVRVTLTNKFVRALLTGKAYRIQKVAPWLSSKGRIVVVGFYRPSTISGTWMAVGKPAYWATYHKVLSLQVYVALAQRTVVAIVPHLQSVRRAHPHRRMQLKDSA